MALKKCNECGHEVSTKANACPSCGAVLRRKTGCITYVFGFGLIGFLLLVFMADGGGRREPTTKPEAGLVLPSLGQQLVTFEEYERIQNGMSYQQVVGIIGEQGEEMSQNKMAGVPGVMDSITTVMYQWVNGNGSNMNAIFQNDQLMQKAQFGLR